MEQREQPDHHRRKAKATKLWNQCRNTQHQVKRPIDDLPSFSCLLFLSFLCSILNVFFFLFSFFLSFLLLFCVVFSWFVSRDKNSSAPFLRTIRRGATATASNLSSCPCLFLLSASPCIFLPFSLPLCLPVSVLRDMNTRQRSLFEQYAEEEQRQPPSPARKSFSQKSVAS